MVLYQTYAKKLGKEGNIEGMKQELTNPNNDEKVCQYILGIAESYGLQIGDIL